MPRIKPDTSANNHASAASAVEVDTDQDGDYSMDQLIEETKVSSSLLFTDFPDVSFEELHREHRKGKIALLFATARLGGGGGGSGGGGGASASLSVSMEVSTAAAELSDSSAAAAAGSNKRPRLEANTTDSKEPVAAAAAADNSASASEPAPEPESKYVHVLEPDEKDLEVADLRDDEFKIGSVYTAKVLLKALQVPGIVRLLMDYARNRIMVPMQLTPSKLKRIRKSVSEYIGWDSEKMFAHLIDGVDQLRSPAGKYGVPHSHTSLAAVCAYIIRYCAMTLCIYAETDDYDSVPVVIFRHVPTESFGTMSETFVKLCPFCYHTDGHYDRCAHASAAWLPTRRIGLPSDFRAKPKWYMPTAQDIRAEFVRLFGELALRSHYRDPMIIPPVE